MVTAGVLGMPVVVALSSPAMAAEASGGAGSRPNIVLILVDDMGYSDIGCYGSEIQTPNLDKLAVNGLRFTQFYNTARCCPTRASLLTGLYPHQAHIGHMMEDKQLEGYQGELSKQAVTIAEVLQASGYGTYMVGKWHVTSKVPPGPTDNWPVNRGFDRYYGIIGGASNYFTPATLVRDLKPLNKVQDDTEYKAEHYYTTDAFADNAVRFIGEHCEKTPDKPFFVYTAFNAPHWPLHAPADVIAKYRGKYKVGWEAIREARYKKQLDMGLIDKSWKLSGQDSIKWDSLDAAKQDEMDFRMAIYAAQVDRMDQNVGKIVEELKKRNRLDNTLLLFLSDNGGCAEGGMLGGQPADMLGTDKGYMLSYGQAWANVSNTPFRTYKHWVHEGGISTPLIAHWPARITRKGVFEKQPGHLIDLMATCVDVAGAAYPKEYHGQKILPMEGRSLVPAFTNQPIQRDAIFWEHEGNRALRVGDWKLVAKGPQGAWELYDMSKDRTELHDLAETQPDRVKQMVTTWEAWAKRTMAVPWPWKGAYTAENAPPKSAQRKAAGKEN